MLLEFHSNPSDSRSYFVQGSSTARNAWEKARLTPVRSVKTMTCFWCKDHLYSTLLTLDALTDAALDEQELFVDFLMLEDVMLDWVCLYVDKLLLLLLIPFLLVQVQLFKILLLPIWKGVTMIDMAEDNSGQPHGKNNPNGSPPAKMSCLWMLRRKEMTNNSSVL